MHKNSYQDLQVEVWVKRYFLIFKDTISVIMTDGPIIGITVRDNRVFQINTLHLLESGYKMVKYE